MFYVAIIFSSVVDTIFKSCNLCIHSCVLRRELIAPYSRVTFKAQLKVGWQPKIIVCYVPKCWSYPEVYQSARNNWPLLVRAEKSKMASKMAARNKCKGVLYMICFSD